MDSAITSVVTPSKSKLARAFAKVRHIRALTGVAPVNAVKNVKSERNSKGDEDIVKVKIKLPQTLDESDEKLKDRVALEAFLATLFASISSIKAAYAQLQYAQSPYDADGIQEADKLLVSELKNLSQLKQCYLKKEFDPSPETALLAAEIKERQGVLKTFEIMGKKLESQVRLKESEILFLAEKVEDAKRNNMSIEKRLNQSGHLGLLDNIHITALSPSHFILVLLHTVKSIRSFVRLMVDEMRCAGWDIDAAVNAIEPNVIYWKEDHRCYAFESFVCREMFDSFQFPNFSTPDESRPNKNQQQVYFRRFIELKFIKPKEYLAENPKSKFAKFCRTKYLRLIHPKMESSFFGNLSQRNLTIAGEFPNTSFFTLFAEMAKRVWLLHCLAFSFQPEASIFLVSKGCRFSEVYMGSVNDEIGHDPQVAFTVVPGFKIGKTVIQCQVYLSQFESKVNKNNSKNQR